MQAVITAAAAPLTTNPALWAQNPQQSRLVDELLLGMPVEITGEAEQHMVPVRTFYGYTGWAAQDALLTGPRAEEWLARPQMRMSSIPMRMTTPSPVMRRRSS